jgi:hypothetical protein
MRSVFGKIAKIFRLPCKVKNSTGKSNGIGYSLGNSRSRARIDFKIKFAAL